MTSKVCDQCGSEFRFPDQAKKDGLGKFHTVPGGYYIPFRCQHCRGLFCYEHRLPENHTCVPRSVRNFTRENTPSKRIEQSIAHTHNKQINYPTYQSKKRKRDAKTLVKEALFLVLFLF